MRVLTSVSEMALSAIDLPWSIGAAQLAIGSVFVLTLWMIKLRNAPRLSTANIKALSPIAACHMLSHACAHIGLGAVASNLATSACAILSKRSMGMEVGNNMDPANFYAVVHIMASAMLLPLALVLEGPRIQAVWGATFTTAEEGNEIVDITVASGVFFFLLNEASFRCLGRVHPVTHAVGNTFKALFLIAAALMVFKSTLAPLQAVGFFMASVGALQYSLAKE
eukprot:g12957.t1